MSNIDSEIILARLRLIAKYYNTLQQFTNLTLDDFLADFNQQLIVERLLQLIIQSAIDINYHMISRLQPGTPFSNFEGFIELAKQGIITEDLAKQLAPSAGLRNRLVHEYDDIDSRQIFKAISFALQQYPLYVEQINNYLIYLGE